MSASATQGGHKKFPIFSRAWLQDAFVTSQNFTLDL